MQRLRAWFYIKNNKKKAAILVVSFGLYFALVYGVHFFVDPNYYMAEVLVQRPARQMQVAYLNQMGELGVPFDDSLWEIPDATYEDKVQAMNQTAGLFVEKLKNGSDAADHIFLCNMYQFQLTSLAGTNSMQAPMLQKEELETMLSYLGISIVEGRMPEHPGEMVVDRKVMKNGGFSIGGTVFDKQTTIVGVVESNFYFAAGIDYEDVEYPDRYLIFLDHGTIPDLKKYMEQFGVTADKEKFVPVQIYSDEENSKEIIKEFQKEIDVPMSVMTYAISAVMGLTLLFVYQLHVQDRYTEWCLYRSLGFSEKEVYFLALREYGICVGLGVLFAVVTSTVICLAGGFLMTQKGIVFRVLLPEVLLRLIAVGVLLTGFLQIPAAVAVRRVRTVDAMEEE